MRRFGLVALALCALAAPRVALADAAPTYAEAAALYEQQQFAEAFDAFRRLVADEAPNPATLLGLGNAAYRSGDFVSATYAYEWGLRLKPGDEALTHNAGMARAHLVADVFQAGEPQSSATARILLARMPGRWTLIAGLVLWTLGWLLLAARQRGRLEGWTWLGVALLLAALPAFAHAGWQRQRLGGRVEGILQAAEVVVRSGPGQEYQSLYELHAGTVVRVLEERSGWRRVALPNGAEGWVQDPDLAVFGAIITLSPH